MTQSAEYPDLKFVEPRAWNSGRASGQPSVIVIHSTDGSEGPTSAEDGAAYDARRTDGTSTHYFHDQNTTIQCVLTKDRANHARASGNRIGIGHELCGSGSQSAAQWADAASAATLLLAAKQCARDAKKWGIPIRHLTPAQIRNGEKGFAGHVDITNAFHESDHTDPGPSFPWSQFLSMVAHETDISPMNGTDKNEVRQIVREELAGSADDFAKAVWSALENINTNAAGPVNNQRTGSILRYTSSEHHGIQDTVDALSTAVEDVQHNLVSVQTNLLELLARVPAPPK